ncbi:MAG: CDP-alcohol phosphatidyltransferase family protein [Proteobacteria bacterium]|nr:CDP-alcohol phosphatidyltransferase family protein [Pseudomonadota bacterium]
MGRVPTILLRDATRDAVAVAAILAAKVAGSVAGGWMTGVAGAVVLIAYIAACFIILRGLGAHAPHVAFGLANRITLVRVAIVCLIVGLAISDTAMSAWAVVVAALIAIGLDGVDGAVARHHGTQSAFGARFDMEVDAALILSLAAALVNSGKVGAWILLAGALRYLFVAAGRMLPWLAAPLPPRRRRQAICVIQELALAAALLPIADAAAATAIAGIVLVLTASSFAIDIFWLARRTTHKEVSCPS